MHHAIAGEHNAVKIKRGALDRKEEVPRLFIRLQILVGEAASGAPETNPEGMSAEETSQDGGRREERRIGEDG